MSKYTIESLKELNLIYDNKYGVTQGDVDQVNEIIAVIESSRSKTTPQIGDVVQFTDQYGEYYPNAHIESVGDEIYLCENAYVPFVSFSKLSKSLYTTTSGGAWSYIPKTLEFVGVQEKIFKVWGHYGACADGAVAFKARVNVWRYTDGEHQFTTEHYDKFYLSIVDDPKKYAYKYLITQSHSGMSYTAFKTKKEYEAWLKTYRGVEVDGYSEKNKIVWTFKQISKCVPLEQYEAIGNAVIDSDLENACIQECKRLYEDRTVITFFPYQNEKIELKGEKRYMKAYQS